MEKRILVVGLTALDIVNICEAFPLEDEDMRVSKQYWQKGGNAANTSEVLAGIDIQLKVDLFSCFVKSNPLSEFCRNYLRNKGVNTEYCVEFEGCGFPTSCCIVARKTGSRTILHSRNDLPELNLEHFKKTDLSKYSWVHFEGRGFPYLKEMVEEAASVRDSGKAMIKVSVEFEKPSRYKSFIDSNIASLVDVLFVSKDFATFLGYTSAKETVMDIKIKLELQRNLIVICAWGDAGADAIDGNNVVYHSNAFSPENVVDTLGAGDTFNAGVLNSLVRGDSLQDAIVSGCTIAGRKCGQLGFDNLSL